MSGGTGCRIGDHGKVRTDLGAVVGEGVRGLILQREGRTVVAGDTQGPGGADVGLASTALTAAFAPWPSPGVITSAGLVLAATFGALVVLPC